MTQEQGMILLRDALKIGGTIAALFGVADGVITTWTDIILTIGGPIVALAAIFWSQARHTASGIVSQASALKGVTEITVTTNDLASAAKSADASTQVKIGQTKPAF